MMSHTVLGLGLDVMTSYSARSVLSPQTKPQQLTHAQRRIKHHPTSMAPTSERTSPFQQNNKINFNGAIVLIPTASYA
jgi:hypothetical protein